MSVSQITTLLKCTTDTNHFLSIAKGQKCGKCPYVMTAPCTSWWRHQMEIFSALLDLYEGNPPVTGGFPSQRPVTRGFEGFFYLSSPEQTVEQTIETPVIWGAIALIMTSLLCMYIYIYIYISYIYAPPDPNQFDSKEDKALHFINHHRNIISQRDHQK